MRIKSHWFKEGREHSVEELAGAVAFTISKIAVNALQNTRKAKFDVAVGPQYFAFLSEFLIFLILVADRIGYRQFGPEARAAFTGTLANRAGETYAENESRLLGGDCDACKRRFIDRLNQRMGEYADFDYDENGPSFHFSRYLGYCIEQVMDEADSFWVADQMISIEAPRSVEMIEKAIKNLSETGPRVRRERRTAGD